MTVATLIEQLQKKAEPTDEVFIYVSDTRGRLLIKKPAVFNGQVIGTGTGAMDGVCEIYAVV